MMITRPRWVRACGIRSDFATAELSSGIPADRAAELDSDGKNRRFEIDATRRRPFTRRCRSGSSSRRCHDRRAVPGTARWCTPCRGRNDQQRIGRAASPEIAITSTSVTSWAVLLRSATQQTMIDCLGMATIKQSNIYRGN